MPSHNMIEVCNSFINYIKTNDIDKSIGMLKGADFSLGGKIIYNKETFEQIYKTGRGSFTLTGSYKFDKNENKIIITEVPYETYIEDIESKLRFQYDKGNFKEVIDIHDSSDIKGIALDIYLKKGTDVNNFIAKLRRYTPYENKFSCNFTILDLDCKTPKLMSLEDIIQTWLQHRYICINKEMQYDINKINVDLNKLYGFKIILNDLDTAIKLIRASKSEKQAIESLINHFKLNQEQSEYVSTIRLVNINKEWMFNKIKNIKELENKLKELNSHLDNKEYINSVIIEQLEYCKKTYGKPRMTEILYEDNTVQISDDSLIEDYNTIVQLTSESYLKKIPSISMRGNPIDKLKDGDKIIYQENSTNKSVILITTSLGNCYKLYQSDIEDVKSSQLGLYLPQELQLEKNENIVGIICTTDYSGNIIEIFKNGKIAKIELKSFQTEQKRSKLKNSLALESPLIKMFLAQTDVDIVLQSSINKVLITNTSIIESKSSKNARGNMIMKSKSNSFVKLADVLDNINTELLDVEYYKGSTGIGSYMKKADKLLTKI